MQGSAGDMRASPRVPPAARRWERGAARAVLRARCRFASFILTAQGGSGFDLESIPDTDQQNSAFCIPFPRGMWEREQGGVHPCSGASRALCQRLPQPMLPPRGPPLILLPLVTPVMRPNPSRSPQPWLSAADGKAGDGRAAFRRPAGLCPVASLAVSGATCSNAESNAGEEPLCHISKQNSCRYTNDWKQQLSLRRVLFESYFQQD